MTVHYLGRLGKSIFRKIVGSFKDYGVDLTASVSTTDLMDIRGLAWGCVYNETGGNITLTYYSARKSDGTPRLIRSQDNAAGTQTIADGECIELPTRIAVASFFGAVLSSGTASGVWFHFER